MVGCCVGVLLLTSFGVPDLETMPIIYRYRYTDRSIYIHIHTYTDG